MSKSLANILAALMLVIMLGLAFFSEQGDSAIIDEVAHLPAGYSYIEKADMRLNPEHPPLIKDLAGGAIWLWSKIFNQKINFPEDSPAWQNAVNGQWDFGFSFLYKSGNNADLMMFLGRLPTLLIMLLLGYYIFRWAKELFGPGTALLSLFFYAFSPTFLAHSRFVTTDVAAAAGIFISSYYFIRWLKAPTAKNIIIGGLVFGLAQLAKFSSFLLVILFTLITLIWIALKTKEDEQRARRFGPALLKNTWRYFGGLIALMGIGFIFVVWPVYIFHTFNYPIARQQSDTAYILSSFGMRGIANLIIWLSGIPILRALSYYGLGLAMVLQRSVGGNTTYFLGEIYNLGWPEYFPVVYLLKETLTLHILTALALIYGVFQFFKNKLFNLRKFFDFVSAHIAEFLMLVFIALYWIWSARSILNIGVRHILPTFAFIFILVSGQIINWLKPKFADTNLWIRKPLKQIFRESSLFLLKFSLLITLFFWQIYGVLSVYPSFLAYFNELAGGPRNGYKFVVDSNLDWGQDMKRLNQWLDENGVEKIYVDYFGGGIPEYYLGNKFLPWWGERSPRDLNEHGGWLAVSATFLQGGRGATIKGFRGPTGYYKWLDNFQPTATIGHSIFVYYIPAHSF